MKTRSPIPFREFRTVSSSHPLVLLVAVALSPVACSDAASGPDGPGPIRGNALEGRIAFEESCAGCHTAGDGIDLAYFAFPDSTIVRRAVAHVDTPTAHDIVAHIGTMRPVASRTSRLFQPGGQAVAGDLQFAIDLFGGDLWPADLGSAELAAIDPRDVRIALDMPLWSEEETNLDWMPDVPAEPGVMTYVTELGVPEALLARYYETRTLEDLSRAVVAFRIAERDPANPEAPCVMDPFDRFEAELCFETRRWVSTLVTQHMLRTGDLDPIASPLHDEWWDVGNAARRSRTRFGGLENAEENWAVWMYLGWSFDPARHASVYLGNAFLRLGLPRHATFHALRAQVSRGARSRAVYHDVDNAARFAPASWTFDAVSFGYEEILSRLENGWVPRDADIADARSAIESSYARASEKVTPGEAAELAALRDRILAYLN